MAQSQRESLPAGVPVPAEAATLQSLLEQLAQPNLLKSGLEPLGSACLLSLSLEECPGAEASACGAGSGLAMSRGTCQWPEARLTSHKTSHDIFKSLLRASVSFRL